MPEWSTACISATLNDKLLKRPLPIIGQGFDLLRLGGTPIGFTFIEFVELLFRRIVLVLPSLFLALVERVFS